VQAVARFASIRKLERGRVPDIECVAAVLGEVISAYSR